MKRTRTPDGARLEIYRDGRWVKIIIDRWPIHDADDEQADWHDRLQDSAMTACFTRGRRKGICFGGGRTIFDVTCPREHEQSVMAALFGIEDHDYTLAARYITENPSKWPPREERRCAK
ncbi:hypothetical protein [Rhodococcus sp. LB1]|uniref:hypothetical protein n=1 Tax=Rhodococcus sp. LB1 TaxID=1807499 RepID=UPI00077B0F38|nr:hypothetical protein [Rhodococcus sp. LB1]KXX59707.1 hypothetical protein AZG88_06720 [Rhodococcus sp. LB1]